MMKTPSSTDIEDVKLPLIFIFTGLLMFIAAQIILVFKIPDLVKGIPGSPQVLATAHLTLLGFGTMVAMGSMYQLVPVALQIKIRFRRLPYPQYVIFVAGVIGLAWSLIVFNTSLLTIFGALTVIGVLLFVFNMMFSIRGGDRGPIKTAVGLALFFLMLTVLLGLTIAVDFFHPYLHEWHERLFHVHILFGTLGWFTLLIVGLSFKLAPMFTLSHKYESRFGPASIHLIHIGMWVTTIGLMTSFSLLAWLGAAVIFAGFICYAVQMKKVLSHRLKKKYDLGLRISFYALPLTFVLMVLASGCGILVYHSVLVTAIVYPTIIGWISLVIMGYLFKIIPFLWWTYKYGEKAGQRGIPLLKDMINEKRGRWWFILYLSSTVLITAALTFHLFILGWIIQLVFLLTSVGYAIELTNVLRK